MLQRWIILAGVCIGWLALPVVVFAACNPPPGTVINKQNWMQYKDCFSEGVQHFWQGDLVWQMPADTEIHVGPQHHWTLPRPFVAANEQYGSQTRLVKLPSGRYTIENYVAGLPFPTPSGPDKGSEIAADVTYRMQGYLVVIATDTGGAAPFYTKDRFGNWNVETVDAVYRQLAYNWETDQGIPRVNPLAAGAWYTEWLMVETPEQSRYTSSLTIYWQDFAKDEDNYALCRHCGARCVCLLLPDVRRCWAVT